MPGTAHRRGHHPARVVALLAAAIVLVSMSSGCINAYWTKGILNPEKKAPVYQTNVKVLQVHFFETNPFDLTTLESHVSNTTTIKDGTQWMRVELDIQMEPPPAQLQPIIQLIPFNISRFVHVVITMPDGTAWYDHTLNVTGNVIVDIQTPMTGDWNFKVDSYGVGVEKIGFHDGYKVIAHAYEPTK